MIKVKNFVIYNKPFPIYNSEVFIPIQTGCNDTNIDLNILKDNTGDNISSKNKNYADLTAWYWILKNYIPYHQEVDYIGICHYRRFLDITNKTNLHNFVKIEKDLFYNKIFTKCSTNESWDKVNGYDLVVPIKERVESYCCFVHTVYHQFLINHPVKDLLVLFNIIEKEYPEYIKATTDVFVGNKMYWCSNFTLKKNLFIEMVSWIIEIIEKLESRTNFGIYGGTNIRYPAFLAERFVNVWYEKNKDRLKILETDSYLLV